MQELVGEDVRVPQSSVQEPVSEYVLSRRPFRLVVVSIRVPLIVACRGRRRTSTSERRGPYELANRSHVAMYVRSP